MDTNITTTRRRPRAPNAGEKDGSEGRLKAAELAPGLGAVVLGAALALVLPEWLRAHATALLVGGAVVHGTGMTLKYRLEARKGPPLRWERALFWVCWAVLTAPGIWIAVAFAIHSQGQPCPLTFQPWEG